MSLNIDLSGKRALVTGGISGIGEAISIALAAVGSKVVVNCHSHPEAAEQTLKKIRNDGGKAISIQADVADANQVASMFSQMNDSFGGKPLRTTCVCCQ